MSIYERTSERGEQEKKNITIYRLICAEFSWTFLMNRFEVMLDRLLIVNYMMKAWLMIKERFPVRQGVLYPSD